MAAAQQQQQQHDASAYPGMINAVPYAAAAYSDKSASSEDGEDVISRQFLVEFTGSLADFMKNPDNAIWQAVQNSIYKTRTRYRPGAQAIADSPKGNISNVILHSIELEESQNTFPVTLGVTFPGVAAARGNIRMGDGNRFAAILLPRSSSNKARTLVVENKYVNSRYIEDFPGFTPDKVNIEGVITTPGAGSHLVIASHPVVKKLRKMDPGFEAALNQVQAVEFAGNYYIPIVNDLFKSGISALKKDIETKLPWVNLSKFKVKIERPNEVWDAAVPHENASEADMDDIYEDKGYIAMLLRVKYRFVGSE